MQVNNKYGTRWVEEESFASALGSTVFAVIAIAGIILFFSVLSIN